MVSSVRLCLTVEHPTVRHSLTDETNKKPLRSNTR